MDARYEDRINRAIALIDRDIDRDLPLERLADEACLSPFHFHRLFTVLTGEGVHALTTRMRMQRALALTARGQRPQWKAIAHAVGYRSPDVFTRAFRRHYGCTPSQFDLESWWRERPDREAALAVSQYFLRPAPPLPADFVVSIERRPAADLIVSRSIGAYVDPARMGVAYERVRQAADKLQIVMASRLSGASQDDPELVPLSRCRYDFALEVPPGTVPPRPLIAARRSEGRWAVTHVKGGLDAVDRACNLLFKSWLPQSGLRLRDAAAEEIYRAMPEAIGWDRFDLMLAIPLED
jgi:AraC family transcriptional regulator